MKFLCIACNTQMKLIKNEENTVADSKGSLSVKWECPDCLYEMGMLTNPYETQLVSSIGVEIGGNKINQKINKEGSSESAKATSDNPSETSSGPKCPFPETVRDAMINSAREGGMAPGYSEEKKSTSGSHGLNEAEQLKSAMGFDSGGSVDSAAGQGEVTWTAQAMVRLQNIPQFIRPVAKKGIEKFALGKGQNTVDENILDQAKDHFNM